MFNPQKSTTSKLKGGSFSTKNCGFTLIELLVVVFIISVASVVAVLSIRGSANQEVMQNAQQLASFLDSVRATARAEKNALVWRCDASGLSVQGVLPISSKPKHLNWQQGIASCEPAQGVIGPEPITKAQIISVYDENNSGKVNKDVTQSVQIGTDGLGPYKLSGQ